MKLMPRVHALFRDYLKQTAYRKPQSLALRSAERCESGIATMLNPTIIIPRRTHPMRSPGCADKSASIASQSKTRIRTGFHCICELPMTGFQVASTRASNISRIVMQTEHVNREAICRRERTKAHAQTLASKKMTIIRCVCTR
jgi:hypothetical protein